MAIMKMYHMNQLHICDLDTGRGSGAWDKQYSAAMGERTNVFVNSTP